MKGIKSNEAVVYTALSDSFASIEQIYLNDKDLMTIYEYRQLEGIRNILRANKENLIPWGKYIWLGIVERCNAMIKDRK